MEEKKTLNRRELARLVSQRTGFTIEDVETVLTEEDYVITEAIKQGVDIKKHKLFKIEIETKKEKKAWDGINERHFIIPEKKIIKIKPLSAMIKAINELNGATQGDED